MIPNLDRAAAMAAELTEKYRQRTPDPLAILETLDNVLLVSHDMPCTEGDNQDAITIVSRTGEGLRYIVIFNRAYDPYMLRFALARELGKIVLEHDGRCPEEIWLKEAECFAYHFICPQKKPVINYRPVRICLSWEMKDAITFGSIREMKEHIAEEQSKISHFIGKEVAYNADDIKLISNADRSWENGFDVVLDGNTIGYCGN